MGEEDDLRDDPEARRLQPLYSKRALVLATLAGAAFGLLLAIASLLFERRHPHLDPTREDAGRPSLPEALERDAGPAGAPTPWLSE